MSDAIARASRMALAFSSSVTLTPIPRGENCCRCYGGNPLKATSGLCSALLLARHLLEVALAHPQGIEAQLAGVGHQKAADVNLGRERGVAIALDVLDVRLADLRPVRDLLQAQPRGLAEALEVVAGEDGVRGDLRLGARGGRRRALDHLGVAARQREA